MLEEDESLYCPCCSSCGCPGCCNHYCNCCVDNYWFSLDGGESEKIACKGD